MKISSSRNETKDSTVDKEGGKGSFAWSRVFLIQTQKIGDCELLKVMSHDLSDGGCWDGQV